MSASVAIVGVHGYGRNHLAALEAADRAGTLKLAAVCDLRPPPGGYADHRAMLDEVRPDVVVIATPPATHLDIAVDAARAGADVLLEKPPVLSATEHRRLASVLDETGRSCQVGFQNLGSASLAAVRDTIAAGGLGRVTAVVGTGRWIRTDGYYRRTAWAGRQSLNGGPTGDGALTNPFAHAVQTCLTLARAAGAAGPRRMALELYRARDGIEVDDTSYVSVDHAAGPAVAVAVTLCAADSAPPRVTVHGAAGRAVLEYTVDRLALRGGDPRAVPGRVSLLDNLIAHRDDPAVPLLAPLADTAGFTDVLAAVGDAPVHPVDRRHVTVLDSGDDRRLVLAGVDAAVEDTAEHPVGFAERRLPWATATPATLTLPPT